MSEKLSWKTFYFNWFDAMAVEGVHCKHRDSTEKKLSLR